VHALTFQIPIANVAYGQVFTLSIVIAVFYSADNIAIIVITDRLLPC